MLRWLRIENVAVIERLEVDLEPGLNLLTGETGAGKSILIDALGMILGERATTELLRTGAERAVVEAGFDLEEPPEALVERLREAGVDAEDELVVRRELTSAGRGKIAVNGSSGSRALLRAIAPYLVDVHGQGESSSLLRPEAALDVLDAFGGSYPLREQVGSAFADLTAAAAELASHERADEEREARREFAEFISNEIEKFNLKPEEDEELMRERTLLAHAEKLKSLSDSAYESLYEDEASAISRVVSVYRRVEELAAIDASWATHLKDRDAVTGQLEELALALRDYRETVDVSPGRLDEVESRLSQLERLKSKYGGSLEAVQARAEQARKELSDLEHSSERLEELREAVATRRSKYGALAGELSRMRANAGKKLAKAVAKELPSLALAKARVAFELERGAPSETGSDRAELLFSANPGEDPRPLARVASGGELSRFLLALKSVAAREDRKVLVFDEVDAGIGGRVADAVGEKLLELAKTHQVLCVTHLPQIASFASAHFRIDKMETRGRIETKIARLDDAARIDEIARMLAGAEVTESAREHARQLIADNRRA